MNAMTYQELVKTTPVVLVEFFASWCPHCQRMMPVVAQVKAALEGKADVYQFDVDKYAELTDEEKVESYPTFIIYKGGKEVWRSAGEMPGSELLSKVESYL